MAKAKKEKMEANPFKLKKELPRLPGYIIVTLWTAFIFCMIGWIILASLSTTKEIFTGSLLASGLHFENYTKALFTNKAALNLLNSVIYTVPSCILIIVVCAPAAYCMSRFKFRGAGLIQALIIIGLAIPNIMIVMPLFSIVSALNLSGTHFTLIFLYTACSVPYTTFFLLTFFKGISTSFEEAAAIDGCGIYQMFFKIIFPLIRPAIATVSIFTFISSWNELMFAVTFINKSQYKTLTVGIMSMVGAYTTKWGEIGAGLMIATIPTVIMYLLLSALIILITNKLLYL
mgnify:CR=1 FL=1